MRLAGLVLVCGLAAALPGGASAQDPPAPRDFILRGFGATMPCGEWMELRNASTGIFAGRQRELYRATIGWALGYLSGAARYGTNLDPLRSSDDDATVAWLADFCGRAPETPFRLAIEAFVDAHPAP